MLILYYACIKLRHYLLSSTCIVTCQADVIKHILQKPILSGRIGKWAYALVEYDLAYESLKSVKGQIVADLIVEHRINDEHDLEVGYITCTPWKLYFDGSVCDDGRGVGIGKVLISSSGSVDLRHQMRQIRCGNMKESGCSASPCHILHITKGKAPERWCMTDWARTNLVSSNRPHRSDWSNPTGQTSLSKDRPSPILQSRNIISRRMRRMCSLCKWILGRLPPMMLLKSVM